MNILKFIETFADERVMRSTGSRRDSFTQFGNIGKTLAIASIPFGLSAMANKALAKDITATPATPPTPPTPPAYGSTTTTRTGVERTVTSKTVTNGDGHDYTNAINQELMKDGIISSTNKLSYKLNKDELIVNGVKQTAEVQQKYKKRFLKNDKHSLMYNFMIENN